MTRKIYGSACVLGYSLNIYVNDKIRKTRMWQMLAAFMSLIVSFVEEVFLLLGWKEAWFLLLPKMDGNHVVTWHDLMELYTTWLRLLRDGNVTSWQRMEINDDWWCSKGASTWFLPHYKRAQSIMLYSLSQFNERPLCQSAHCLWVLGAVDLYSMQVSTTGGPSIA